MEGRNMILIVCFKILFTLQPPVIDKCSMLPVQHYYVRIISSKGEIISAQNDNATTLMFKCLDNQINITITVNITVVDIKGLMSASSVVMKTIGMQNVIRIYSLNICV